MEFDVNKKPIYLQISEMICEKILSGELAQDSRELYVRDYGAELEVNPNTVMRSYEKLTSDGIIYNKRGIGYFISPDAKGKILANERKNFLENELPSVLRKLALLGISIEEVVDIKNKMKI